MGSFGEFAARTGSLSLQGFPVHVVPVGTVIPHPRTGEKAVVDNDNVVVSAGHLYVTQLHLDGIKALVPPSQPVSAR